MTMSHLYKEWHDLVREYVKQQSSTGVEQNNGEKQNDK